MFAGLAGAPAMGLWLIGIYDWTSAFLGLLAAAALTGLVYLSVTGPGAGRNRLGWRRHASGTCPECGYSNEGLGSAPCPECGGRLPPSDLHVRALLAAHSASGPGECVVCGRAFPAGCEGGSPCPSCGSRHRRPAAGSPGR